MTPSVSVIIATHNRRDVLAHTLARLAAAEIKPPHAEIIIVDNASRDDIASAAGAYAGVRLIALDRNWGATAKAFGVEHARGELLLTLDDDSYPLPGALEHASGYFAADPRLGVVALRVFLRDGTEECMALPHIALGGAALYRRTALQAVGGFDPTFFMAAEEYDTCLRLLNRGWGVRFAPGLAVEHLKSPTARRSARTAFYDTRNNLRVWARYLPDEPYAIYAADSRQRYCWLATDWRSRVAALRGLAAGQWLAWRERRAFTTRRLSPDVFEQVFGWARVEQRFRALASDGVRRVAFLDFGKNIYAFWRGARQAGIAVACIGDDRVARGQRRYRGVPLTSVATALRAPVDAVVISNTSFAHVERRLTSLKTLATPPVHAWFTFAGLYGPHAAAEPERQVEWSVDERVQITRPKPRSTRQPASAL